MPIYEYECTKCGAVEEAFQHFSEKPLEACKNCSGNLQKIISHSSFHLKGSGWYVTDYAGKKNNTAPASKTSEESPTSSATTPAAAETSKTSDDSNS